MRHKLSESERLKGLRKGIRTLEKKRGGPKWLLPSMRAYEKRLSQKVSRKRFSFF